MTVVGNLGKKNTGSARHAQSIPLTDATERHIMQKTNYQSLCK